ncbi:MAG: HAD family hydrolase [Candidatus Omnitrophica bacterium]|nr:HAD family hydrolase [Candidatus Omnitrophota bacterium]MBU4302855.1 HAD family hydrolase [Candidatus Omnitrophota bacterium]MBU4418339.1 HAD family hydrolase [Candidatus Omnitrophota bacterium]MBU4468730.1 HAD family hydrolase [Candidatus Omnitrophota bacterium]MCG2707748.1 HAD family hydrolase [Candidatus Omnitrophota bacterium]
MENIKLIIFDLDGTLIDAYTAISDSFNYVMRRLGLKTQSAGLIRSLVGWGDINLLKPYVPKGGLKHALSLYRNHHKHSLLKHAHLYPFVRRLLRSLKLKGYKLAVASNRPSKFSHILLRHLDIGVFFDYVLCADQSKHGKPHPEMLNKIVKRFGFKKSQAFYVGDMVIDAQAGRRAKINTVIVTSGSSSKPDIKREQPFRIISAISRLLELLKAA